MIPLKAYLKKFSVKRDEIAFVVKKIKKQKLSNITPGQKIQFILKKSSKTKIWKYLKSIILFLKLPLSV